MKKLTKQEYQQAKNRLEKSGKDKVGTVATVFTASLGGVAGAAAAPIIASEVGATTLLGSTSLASLLGGVFVTTTPPGWIVGGIAIGAGTAYGLCKLIKSGAKSD